MRDEAGRTADLKALLSAIGGQCLACIDMLADHQPPQPTTLDPESIIYLSANVDAMYYSLLDHHLSSVELTPTVPPPHDFFPAMLAASDSSGDVTAAAKRLLSERAAPHGVTHLREVWGVTEDLTLPTGSNPLLQVCTNA